MSEVTTGEAALVSTGHVVGVFRGKTHGPGKDEQVSIELIEGEGVRGDIHCGRLVKHRSRVKKDPHQPNLRQVHIIGSELYRGLQRQALTLPFGRLGENITSEGIDILALSADTVLGIGDARLRVTGLRNPCRQLENIANGLMAACLEKDPQGNLVRKAGIMAVVVRGGEIRQGYAIEVESTPATHAPLDVV